MESIILTNGVSMPRMGLGTWPLTKQRAVTAVASGIETGFRLIDTAENYDNESSVGEGIRASTIPREDIFVTSKFNAEWHSERGVREVYERSLIALGVDYLDLFLIHWPNPWLGKFPEAWTGLCALHEDGAVRAIGVSNFQIHHLEELKSVGGQLPHVNQVQLNPGLPQKELHQWQQGLGIATQSWRPLGDSLTLLEHPVVIEASQKCGYPPSAVLLAWQLKQGLSFVVRSESKNHLAQNKLSLDVPSSDELFKDFTQLIDTGQRRLDPESIGH